MDVQIEQRAFRLREPLHTAYGALRERTILELTLTGADGLVAGARRRRSSRTTGVPLEQVAAALARYRPVLEAADTMTGIEVLDGCRAVSDEPYALAAVDIALWDRAGRRAGRPIADLLVDVPAGEVPVNATIGATDRAGAAGAAAEAVRAGFGCVKVKVGVGDDAGRVAAVRAAMGPAAALRLDANGAWEVEEAIAAIAALGPAGLELVEEPVHGVHALRQVRRSVAVRIAMDETAAEPGALASAAADAVCLKLSRAGGISGLLAAATLVRTTEAEAYVASTLDGPIGIAAAVHAAAALAPLPACGLATLGLFAGVDPGPLAVRGGAIAVPTGPGLGLGP
jgi:L-alanine-DL-glutamate epimerase-like enolase superfamily enzyme